MGEQLALFDETSPLPTKRGKKNPLDGASPGICKGCHARIFWGMRGNRTHPYNADGRSHFDTCPNAAEFRKHGQ